MILFFKCGCEDCVGVWWRCFFEVLICVFEDYVVRMWWKCFYNGILDGFKLFYFVYGCYFCQYRYCDKNWNMILNDLFEMKIIKCFLYNYVCFLRQVEFKGKFD